MIDELEHLRSDLGGLLGIDCADVFVVFQRVLPVLLLCTDVLLQQAQHLSGLLVEGMMCTNSNFKL